MQSTLVSIIVPVYNTARFLPQTLQTILTQTYSNLEIICVDDGSTDGSLEILQKAAETDSRITVLTQDNRGVAQARNSGLDVCQGEYIALWDSDDLFNNRAIELLLARAQATQSDICICAANILDEKSGDTWLSNNYLKKGKLPKTQPFSSLEAGRYIFEITCDAAWNKLFKRDFVERHGIRFPDLRRCSDAYFTNLALFLAERISTLNKPLITYRSNNPLSLCGQATAFAHPYAYDALLLLKSELEHQSPSSATWESFTNKAASNLMLEIRRQNSWEAFQTYFVLVRDKAPSDFETDRLLEPDFCHSSVLLERYKMLKTGTPFDLELLLRRHYEYENKKKTSVNLRQREELRRIKNSRGYKALLRLRRLIK